MTKKEYAVYKGENILAIGTLKDCAEKLGVKENTIKWYGTPTYAKRTSENARRMVKLDS